MMKHKEKRPRKGDEVEIGFPTQDGIIWHLATVIYDNEDGIEVMFPSGYRRRLPHDGNGYRWPRRQKCMSES